MIKKTTAALAASLSLALVSGAVADTASSTSTAPITVEKFADRPFADIIERHAKAEGVPVELAHAVVTIESNYKASSTGSAGEVGLMQIKPSTARDMGFKGSTEALYDPNTNIKFGMKYLAGAIERGGGTTCGTVLKYNAGHYAKRMNPVSANYCEKLKRELGEA